MQSCRVSQLHWDLLGEIRSMHASEQVAYFTGSLSKNARKGYDSGKICVTQMFISFCSHSLLTAVWWGK